MDFDDGFYDESWDEEAFDAFGNNDRGIRNRQYSNAYGDYRGGYGAPPFRPPGPFMRPPPFPGPGDFFGRGFGPGGPPIQRARVDHPAIKYLMRFGIPRNSLKNLPRNMLDLIEPQYCGLCGHSFDSFSLSRVHYLSKNHQKAQKKFMAQNQHLHLGAPPNEAPLKSRELYCELCDVQITSKVHADSHYSGKSHNAIVEGRKQPKNPLLLQPGMERRVKQLIRREKKHISKMAENESETPAEITEDKKDVKPVQPELYCEICQTAVTCTEQMTAHLNGKRHLTKEKQYILKSMRGEVPVEVKKEPGEANETEQEPEPAQETTTESASAKEDDWHENWE